MNSVHQSAIVEEGANVGEGTKIWHFVHVRKGAEIGINCNIGKGVYVDSGAKIGNNVKIQNFVSIYNGIEIEDDVFIGPSATFTNDLYPRAKVWNDEKIAKITVKKGASIGANATVVGGTVIGEYAMVGAGAVVTKDVKPHALVYGNPATVKGYVCFCGEKLTKKEGSVYECKCGEKVKIEE